MPYNTVCGSAAQLEQRALGIVSVFSVIDEREKAYCCKGWFLEVLQTCCLSSGEAPVIYWGTSVCVFNATH